MTNFRSSSSPGSEWFPYLIGELAGALARIEEALEPIGMPDGPGDPIPDRTELAWIVRAVRKEAAESAVLVSSLPAYFDNDDAAGTLIELNGLLRDILPGMELCADQMDIELELRTPEEPLVYIAGNLVVLGRALQTLLRWILTSSPRCGFVGISVASSDGKALIAIELTGGEFAELVRDDLFGLDGSSPALSAFEPLGLRTLAKLAMRILKRHCGEVILEEVAGIHTVVIRFPLMSPDPFGA